MIHLSSALFILLGVLLLIYLGLLHRVLERMYLTPLWALILIAAIFLTSYLPPLPFILGHSINFGGGIIPLGLITYILLQSRSPLAWKRVFAVTGGVALAIYLTDRFFPVEPGQWGFDLDPLYLPAVVAALLSYLLGRSRRAAFCGAILGVMLAELFSAQPGMVHGGGGLFDVLILSGIVAVLLTEAVGEINERLQNKGR